MIDPTAHIHPSSLIEDGAVIGANCVIGPFCVIGAKVRLGRGVECISHVAIAGDTEIGDETRIWPFASVGHQPQDLKYAGEDTKLVIGKRNMIRESTSINLGTAQGGGITRIGDGNLFMIGAHIGHDCVIGNDIVFANNAAIAGHVTVEDGAVIGGQAGVIQFARVGRGAMVGAGCMVIHDLIPYGLCMGDRPELSGVNYVGLRRRGVEKDGIRQMMKRIDQLFDGTEGLRARAQALKDEGGNEAHIDEILDFILAQSNRSYLSPKDEK